MEFVSGRLAELFLVQMSIMRRVFTAALTPFIRCYSEARHVLALYIFCHSISLKLFHAGWPATGWRSFFSVYYAGCYPKNFPHIVLLYSHNNLIWSYFYLHFTEEEVEGRAVRCLRSHSQWETDNTSYLTLKPRPLKMVLL